jgi:predicted Rossmann fold flavoprotein
LKAKSFGCHIIRISNFFKQCKGLPQFVVDEFDVVVVGAGAAGIMAAWRSATLGARTLLIEKTNRLGTKILISGGGKCNVAHDGELEDVLRAFRVNEARFIRPACYRLTNRQIVKMMTDRGLRVYTRPDGRIFPVDQSAKDVVAILAGYLADAGVEILMNTPVIGLLHEDGKILGVQTSERVFKSPKVVVATGGSSYPNSGTTGDAWPWARALGHRIVKVRAALAPIYIELEGMSPRAGVALRDVVLKARQGTKEIARWRGDLLFTHRGISGPTALGISRVVAEQMESGNVSHEVDLAPDQTFEELGRQLKDWADKNPKKLLAGLAEEFVPKSLAEDLLTSANLANLTSANFGAKAKNRLVETLKGWKLGPVRTVPLEKGECVAGGIDLAEVDPKTMKSKIVEGLYLCGEALDVAGPVGGYNLQAAFATGYVAGEEAATEALAPRSR